MRLCEVLPDVARLWGEVCGEAECFFEEVLSGFLFAAAYQAFCGIEGRPYAFCDVCGVAELDLTARFLEEAEELWAVWSSDFSQGILKHFLRLLWFVCYQQAACQLADRPFRKVGLKRFAQRLNGGIGSA